MADVTSTIEVETATESDGSRVQPTHHGGVLGFVPYLLNYRRTFHVQLHSLQSTLQNHNKSWRSGNLHHSAWVKGHTGGFRSIPTVHPCPQSGGGRACG